MPLSQKSLKAQSRHRIDDSEKVEHLQCQLDSAVANECRAQKSVESPQSQLDTVRATVDIYLLGLHNFTEHVRMDVTEDSGGFLFDHPWEAQELIRKQRDSIELTVRTNFEAVDAFPSSPERNRSEPSL